MALSAAIAAPCIAATADYSFLDGMTVPELEALQEEVGGRLADAKSEEAASSSDKGTSDDSDDFGVWEIEYTVDKFDRPTDESFIRLKKPIDGTFSNSATTKSDCSFQIIIFPYDGTFFVFIRIAEYGTKLVKSSFETQIYDVTVLDRNGNEYIFEGSMSKGSDLLFVNYEKDYFYGADEDELIEFSDVVRDGGPISLYIEEHNGTSSYLFTLEDTSGLENTLNAISGNTDKKSEA